jgi:hypothetical protein
MFEEAKKLNEKVPQENIMQKGMDCAGGRRRAAMVANKKAAEGDDEDNYMDYLLTVAEERHKSHLATKVIDIRYSVKESYQKFFGRGKDEPEENQEDFEIAPTLGIKGNNNQ